MPILNYQFYGKKSQFKNCRILYFPFGEHPLSWIGRRNQDFYVFLTNFSMFPKSVT